MPALHRIYDLNRYDEFFRLKVSPLLWLVLLYGLRHIAAKVFLVRYLNDDFIASLADWRLFASDAVVLVVLYSLGCRAPNARPIMRNIWHAGRHLLLLSYALDLLIFSVIHWNAFTQARGGFIEIASFYFSLNFAVIAYLARSNLVADIFSDFPEDADRTLEKVSPKLPSTKA